MSSEIQRICTAIVAARTSDDAFSWKTLVVELERWRATYEGGVVNSEFIDERLDQIIDRLAPSVFHLSRLAPNERNRSSVILSKNLWRRISEAIERAVIVTSRRGVTLRCPCSPPLVGETLSPRSKCK